MTGQIDSAMANAFVNGNVCAMGNSMIAHNESGKRTYYYLHGNQIGYKNSKGDYFISNADWHTKTTKRRLQALLDILEPNRYTINSRGGQGQHLLIDSVAGSTRRLNGSWLLVKRGS